MKANSIYKQLGEYQTSVCITKTICWNDLKWVKIEKFISVKNRIWVTECVVILYYLCFVRRLDVNFTSSAWICCAFMFYHWAIETVMTKLYRMNYKVIKLKFARQLRFQCFDDAHTLKLWRSDFKKKTIVMSQWLWTRDVKSLVLAYLDIAEFSLLEFSSENFTI